MKKLNLFLDHHILGYMARNSDWDFGILELIHAFKPSKYVQIVKLPKPGATCPKGRGLVMIGWGGDESRPNRLTNKLWGVFQECLPLYSCTISHGANQYVLCVGDHVHPGLLGNYIGHGDSGGNKLYDEATNGQYVLTFINSILLHASVN